MNIRIKQLVFGFCVAIVVLGASTGGACAEDVTYRGVVTGFPDFGGAVGTGGANIRIDEILSDPSGNLEIGDAVTATWQIVPPFADISVTVGDRVEVCGEYRNSTEMPEHWSDVEEHWTDLSTPEHYLVELDIRFSGTAIESIEATMPGAPSGWVVQVDEVLNGPQPCNDQLNVTTAAVAPPVGYMDPGITEGDQVCVYGRYTNSDGCDVSLIGSDDYYIQRSMKILQYRGVVTGFPDFGGAVGTGGANIRIDEIISDPSGNLEIGDAVTATWQIVPPFADISVTVGDRVEVCGEYRNSTEMPEHWSDVEEHWTDLSTPEHYLVELDIRFSGTAIESIEATMPGAPSGWVVQVDEVLNGPQPCNDQLNVTTAAVAPPVGYMDPGITEGDQVCVYGRYTNSDGCDVSLIGSDDYYIQRSSPCNPYDGDSEIVAPDVLKIPRIVAGNI